MMGIEDMKQKDEEKTEEEKKEAEKLKKARELRNKGWEELTANEKIERMRGIIKYSNKDHSRGISNLRETVGKLEKHSHKKGEIVIPLEHRAYGTGECEAKSTSEKVWF